MKKTLYVIKYSLSNGGVIDAINCEIESDSKYAYSNGSYRQQYVLGKDAFATKESAEMAFDNARIRKIASHQKSIQKLEKMKPSFS